MWTCTVLFYSRFILINNAIVVPYNYWKIKYSILSFLRSRYCRIRLRVCRFLEPDPDLQHKYNTNLFLDENTLPSRKIFLVKIQFQNAKKRNKSLPREKATPTMAMPRPLVAGVDTSVMIAVDRDTLPISKNIIYKSSIMGNDAPSGGGGEHISEYKNDASCENGRIKKNT